MWTSDLNFFFQTTILSYKASRTISTFSFCLHLFSTRSTYLNVAFSYCLVFCYIQFLSVFVHICFLLGLQKNKCRKKLNVTFKNLQFCLHLVSTFCYLNIQFLFTFYFVDSVFVSIFFSHCILEGTLLSLSLSMHIYIYHISLYAYMYISYLSRAGT